MATKKNNDRVTVTLPRAHKNEERDLLVSINGKAYIVPKGETSEVPPEVAEEIERADRAEIRRYKLEAEMQKKAPK